MKNIIKSLVIVVAVAAVASIATYAYFSDNLVVANNTYSAGTLDIVYSGTASTTFNVASMEPGVWYGDQAIYPDGNWKLTVNNSGSGSTMAAKYRFRNAQAGGSNPFYNALNARVYRHEMVGSSHVWVQYYTGTLASMMVDSTLASVMANLPPDNAHEWKFAFQLDPSADNTLQGASATINLYVDATQASNPGW